MVGIATAAAEQCFSLERCGAFIRCCKMAGLQHLGSSLQQLLVVPSTNILGWATTRRVPRPWFGSMILVYESFTRVTRGGGLGGQTRRSCLLSASAAGQWWQASVSSVQERLGKRLRARVLVRDKKPELAGELVSCCLSLLYVMWASESDAKRLASVWERPDPISIRVVAMLY